MSQNAKYHAIPVRVYFEDTDAGGVVFYANYLKFTERGRTELLRFLGFENKSLLDHKGLAFVVRHIEADYLKPAFLDDELEMRTEVIHLKNASIVMKQSLFRHDLMIFSSTVTMVCIDIKKLVPSRLPDDLRQKFESFITNQ